MTIELANKLAELRKQKGLSQEELADKLNVSRQTISKWERGEASPDTDNLIELAKLYEISLDKLLGLKAEEENKEAKSENEEAKIKISNSKIEINDGKEKVILIDDDDDDEKECRHGHKPSKLDIAVSCITTILVVAAYLLLGFLLKLWDKAWVLFFLVIIVPGIFETIEKKDVKKIPFVSTVVAVYLSICLFVAPIWHPLWVIFLTIPIFEVLIRIKKDKKE